MATVIFKPTTACNARCVYCDGVREWKVSSPKMGMELLELFFYRINEFLLARPQESMEIVWHGGEPLSLGPEYFSEALRLQQKHCPDTAPRIRHCIQSNLTLLTREFFAPLRALGINSFGSSYEMIDNIRGLGPNRDSASYNRRFMDAVSLLEEEGFQWGVIYVVTKPALSRPVEIFQQLANLSPRGAFSFNPVLLYGHELENLRVTPTEYAHFLGTIFPLWWRQREELAEVHPFRALVGGFLGEHKGLSCCDSGICANTHFSVGPDGAISHCGRSADWNLLNYGSIQEKSLEQVFGDPQRALLLQRNSVLPEGDCKDCRYWDICHGGCPLDSWSGTASFLHKSGWCLVKKIFLEEYVEPMVNSGAKARSNGCKQSPSETRAAEVSVAQSVVSVPASSAAKHGTEVTWIDPYGGLGDALMISGVLKQVNDLDPSRQFHLVDRTKYRAILEGHPAIASIGYPPPGAKLLRTDYWSHDDFRVKRHRAYQVLARSFGLEGPVDELLYVPWERTEDRVLTDTIPWRKFNVLVAHSSVSPRKEMPLRTWESLVAMLAEQDVLTVQATRLRDCYIRGAYSLLGLANPRQVISMLKRFDAVITSDSFLMHAAHLCGVPAVVVWGPTDHRVYGYAEQVHLQAKLNCDYTNGCLGPEHPELYSRPCERGDAHCMNSLSAETIFEATMGLLDKKAATARL